MRVQIGSRWECEAIKLVTCTCPSQAALNNIKHVSERITSPIGTHSGNESLYTTQHIHRKKLKGYIARTSVGSYERNASGNI